MDDTLLDNQSGVPGKGLHERSRLAACQEVGRRYDILGLQELSEADNLAAFLTASEHTVRGSVWNILGGIGLVTGDEIDDKHPLLKEIVDTKHQLYATILREYGREVPGAMDFVRAMHGRRVPQAIGSAAIRQDIDIFLEMMDITDLFPDHRIKSFESVTKFKPDPEVFNVAFESLGLPESARGQVVVFEDDPKGIAAAKAAGLFACAITTRFAKADLLSRPVRPDFAADDYDEIRAYFGFSTEK
ncbi:MAG TPA: HAD family hydrolase [Candidatus Saccharimonadales bacterium]|jgi:beta-phosphoglucomutase-like phosphatase (HAD superfamily)|nr:HAD family hydrolase [Candidatus Saccharimonadales bacterium]